jgi:hypothetical protein
VNLDLHLAADALADLRRLDVELQEEVFDELERLSAKPDLIPPPLPQSGIVHTFACETAGGLHVIAITLERRDGGTRLAVLGVRLLAGA